LDSDSEVYSKVVHRSVYCYFPLYGKFLGGCSDFELIAKFCIGMTSAIGTDSNISSDRWISDVLL